MPTLRQMYGLLIVTFFVWVGWDVLKDMPIPHIRTYWLPLTALFLSTGVFFSLRAWHAHRSQVSGAIVPLSGFLIISLLLAIDLGFSWYLLGRMEEVIRLLERPISAITTQNPEQTPVAIEGLKTVAKIRHLSSIADDDWMNLARIEQVRRSLIQQILLLTTAVALGLFAGIIVIARRKKDRTVTA